MHARLIGLQHQTAVPIRNHPVKRRQRQLLGKRNIQKVHRLQKLPGLLSISTLPQHPGDQLIRRHISLPRLLRNVTGISREIQPGHSQPLLIDRLRVQRVLLRHGSHTDHGIMAGQLRLPAESENIIPRSNHHLLAKMIFQIHISPKIKISIFTGNTCTHGNPSIFPSAISQKLLCTQV